MLGTSANSYSLSKWSVISTVGILRSITFARTLQAVNREGDFATLCKTMKPIEIAKQYETTHFDGEVGQSETKDGVLGINRVVVLGFKGDKSRCL
jgi:hypothetical protein